MKRLLLLLAWACLALLAGALPPAFDGAVGGSLAGRRGLGAAEEEGAQGGTGHGRKLLLTKAGKILSQQFKMMAKGSKKINPKGKLGKNMSHGKCKSASCLKKKMKNRVDRKKKQKIAANPAPIDNIVKHDKLAHSMHAQGMGHLMGQGAVGGRR